MLAISLNSKTTMNKEIFLSILNRYPWKQAISNVDPLLLENKHRYTLIALRLKSLAGLKIYRRLKMIKENLMQK